MAPRPARPADGIAWITGASSGIGRDVALELMRGGWTVAASARREADLASLAALAPAGRIVPHVCDVTDAVATAATVARIEAQHGPIALAYLNAGTHFPGATPLIGEAFRKTLQVNLDGMINCLEPLLPRMQARQSGQIAVTASVAGYGGLPGAAAYCASKSALITMCEALKFDLDRDDVLLQIVCPGFVKTPLTDKNPFPMPFLMPSEEAARRICAGLTTDRFEIAFPRRMSWSLKLLNLLPYRLYFPLVARGTGGQRKG
jgi:NAD(P)-dependent dehydrogenase (short-subunit alcohol dehydrogenase family)